MIYHSPPPLLSPLPPPEPIRLWPIRAVGLLLLIQAAGLLIISLYLLSQVDWEQEWVAAAFSAAAFETATFTGFFVPIAVFMIFAGIGFFFLWRVAWFIAMTTQGLSLFGALSIYFTFASGLNRANFVYLIMLYSIVMVLYLNTNDVRITFQAPPENVNLLPETEIDQPRSDETRDETTHECLD